jgi:NAD(P) transhydrogenase subunit alpha
MLEADVVITTALIPGKPAPVLVPADLVRDMKNGAVIVDMAVGQGGNCELSELDKIVVKEGVTIIGMSNLPGQVPFHASDVYAKNLMSVVHNFYRDAELSLDFDDEINDGSFVTHAGTVRMAAAAEALQAGNRS